MNTVIEKELEFNNLYKISQLENSKNEKYKSYWDTLKNLNVDKVHFSGEFPAILIKEVNEFDQITLKDIAKTLHKVWNYGKITFLYVSSIKEIRIYNCINNPFYYLSQDINIEDKLRNYEIESCKKNEIERLKNIKNIFSSLAIDSGFIWYKSNSYLKEIKLENKVDNFLIKSLIKTAELLNKNKKLQLNIIHSLIMRSLFIMYLEDRGSIPDNYYSQLLKNKKKSYLEVLENKTETYKLFNEIEKHFNGDVFPVTEQEIKNINENHLLIIKRCFTDGIINENTTTLFDWRIFDFSIIPIELLSEIYENFLNKIEKKESGTYYTPPELVELILNNVLESNKDKNYNLKILDPACGSGIFLVESYKRIIKRWINKHKIKPDFKTLTELLKKSIFGVEINPKSIKVASFSLYLTMLNFLDPKDAWLKDNESFPYLINSPDNDENKQGFNLFCTNSIDNKHIFNNIEYDLIVGNPPFGKKVPDYIKKYCNKNDFAIDYVIPFIHKSSIICPDGQITLIFPSKILTNTSRTYQNFRKWMFNDNYVAKIYNLSILRKAPKSFGGQLFSSAVGPVSIIFFSKKNPDNLSDPIEYWAPKTFIKNHIAEGVIIDETDIKYLPREECQKPDTKIWKIAHWGTMADFELIKKLNKNFPIMNDYLIKEQISNGVGFQIIDSSTKKIKTDSEFSRFSYIHPDKLQRYVTSESYLSPINAVINTNNSIKIYKSIYKKNKFEEIPLINKFRRLGNKKTYKAPHVLIKQGLKDKKICSSYLNIDCSFNSKIIGINSKNKKLLKSLTCYLNSIFATYFIFLVSASWGIEREELKKNEIYLLPDILNTSEFYTLEKLYDMIEDIIISNAPLIPSISILKIESEIYEIISNLLKLNKKEKIIIRDLINYNIDLFFKGQESIALHPIDEQNPETKKYAEMLCDEINNFLVKGNYKVSSIVYTVSSITPLCLVVLQINDINKKSETKIINSDKDFNKYLDKINEYCIKEYSKNIYIRKSIRYYDDNEISIIKPNQKRFWTQSQAIEDARNIINEILNMEKV